MKRIILYLIGVALFVGVVGYFSNNLQNGGVSLKQNKTPASLEREKATIKVGSKNVEVEVEIARTENERRKGLSGKEKLQPNHGMLFVFQEETTPSFWMKDMNFSIDIIWIHNGAIVDIHQEVPPPEPGTPESDLKLYKPAASVDHVLEVPAGFVEENDIKVGDSVDLSSIEN